MTVKMNCRIDTLHNGEWIIGTTILDSSQAAFNRLKGLTKGYHRIVFIDSGVVILA